jgi:hypothetical protein
MQYRPTGEFGFATKKSIALEIGNLDEFDDSFRFRYLVNFTYLQPRLEEFKVPTYVSEGGFETFYPGTQKFKTMFNLAFGLGWDFSPEAIDHWKLRPYIGLDIVPGLHLRYTQLNSHVVSSTEFEVAPLLGFKGRAGIQYTFKDDFMFLEIERTYALIMKYAYMNYNNIGIGYAHTF